MMIIAKDAEAAVAIRERLTRLSRDTGGAVADASVNERGLEVSIELRAESEESRNRGGHG